VRRTTGTEATLQGVIPNIDVLEAARRVGLAPGSEPAPASTTTLLVDVRERYEFEAVRAPGVVLIPLTEFGVLFAELPRDRPLLMICAAGSRSQHAGEFLAANGYPDVANVDGGIIAWHAAGLPVAGGPPAPGEGDLPGTT
jgi:rhodanese-related sulfurtransferase